MRLGLGRCCTVEEEASVGDCQEGQLSRVEKGVVVEKMEGAWLK